jgi:hypothetical protein
MPNSNAAAGVAAECVTGYTDEVQGPSGHQVRRDKTRFGNRLAHRIDPGNWSTWTSSGVRLTLG